LRFPEKKTRVVGFNALRVRVRAAPPFILMLFACAAAAAAPTVRIKDIAYLQGVRGNQVLGLGLVTGLSGKGDSTNSSMLKSSLSTLMANFGFSVTPQDVRSRNCAVVMVSAELPPFAREGDTIDVTVSSIGDARDLDGGILLQCNLQAANGQVYAVAQGKVISTPDPAGVRTVGAIPVGAIVEKQALSQYVQDSSVSLILRNPDFVTASAVQKAVEAAFPGIKTTSLDPSMIQIQIPDAQKTVPVAFLAQLEALTLTPDGSGRVVINSSTGIIVMGDKVRIGKVVVSYKSARVTVGSSQRQTTDQPDLFVIGDTATVDDFVSALKTVGLKADAIIGILQAIEKAGALFGTLVIM
jgi:flagellar P-ring protein precursor FlgI